MPARSGWLERSAGHLGAVAGHHVDHAVRQPGGLQQLHPQVRGEGLGEGGLPDHRVAHQGRRGRQVAGDGGEVERRDRVDEAVQRPVVHPVPHPGRADRLVGVQLAGEGDVEAQEVDQLAGRVDLGLLRGLALAEHRRGVQQVTSGSCQQLRRTQEHRCPLVERRGRPVGLRCLGCLRPQTAASAAVVWCTRASRVEWSDGIRTSCTTPPGRGVQPPPMTPKTSTGSSARNVEFLLQAGPFRASGRIAANRFVDGLGYSGDGVHEMRLYRRASRRRISLPRPPCAVPSPRRPRPAGRRRGRRPAPRAGPRPVLAGSSTPSSLALITCSSASR